MSGKTNVVSRSRPEGRAAGLPAPPTDRRADRRSATQAEIAAAAWDLVRTSGLAGLSMRDLGGRVGMRAQSVYSYFASKDDIYDAMFRQGYQEFLVHMTAAHVATPDPVDRLRAMAHRYFAFCTSDPVRYQLLFQRTIPGFEPSPASYAIAIDALGAMQADMAAAGIDDPEAVDLATALLTGLTSQQLANDPGGRRWERLVTRAVDMLLRETAPHLLAPPPEHASTTRRTR